MANGAYNAALAVNNVSVILGGVLVLSDVTFEVGSSALLGVVGPNGGGKSTLFNAIAGLLPLETGRVLVYGRPPDKARGRIAYVPQREDVNWRFPVSAMDVVTLGRSRKVGWLRRPGKTDMAIVQSSLERVGMWDERSSMIDELSGGQRQRVFVARALAQEAEILLLDEAFSGVDVASQEGLVTVLRSLRDDGRTILIATHDLTNMAERFDVVLAINHHICAFGPPETAFTAEVLEELYGAHGVVFGNGGVPHE